MSPGVIRIYVLITCRCKWFRCCQLGICNCCTVQLALGSAFWFLKDSFYVFVVDKWNKLKFVTFYLVIDLQYRGFFFQAEIDVYYQDVAFGLRVLLRIFKHVRYSYLPMGKFQCCVSMCPCWCLFRYVVLMTWCHCVNDKVLTGC